MVYLSMALLEVGFLPGMLVLFAAALSLLLVEERSKIGGRGGCWFLWGVARLFWVGGRCGSVVGAGAVLVMSSGPVAIWTSKGDFAAERVVTRVTQVPCSRGGHKGVAGGVTEPSWMKSGIGKGECHWGLRTGM